MAWFFACADRLLRLASGLALGAAGVIMLMQIFARYVFDAPFVWAEELATLLFSWIIFLGAAVVQRDDSHLSVDSLRARCRPRLQLALDVFRRLAIIGCSAVLIWQGVALSLRMWPLLYPATEISRAWLYLTVPVGALFTILFAAKSIWERQPPARVIPIDE